MHRGPINRRWARSIGPSTVTPFTSFRASVWITHIVTPGGSAHRSPPRSVFRPLVAAPRIDAWLRCPDPDRVTMWVIHTASSERSEGSVALGREMLRCAQHDSAVTHTNAWMSLLHAIIGDGAITDALIILLMNIERSRRPPPS